MTKTTLRKDKTIQWINPEQPVLAGLSVWGTHLDLDRPANSHAPGSVVSRAGKLAGILGDLHSHDLRYGSAFDAANSEERPTGYATAETARSLGHTRTTFDRRGTDAYVGSSYYDHWSHRVTHSPATPEFGLQIDNASYEQPKLSSAQLTELCIPKSLDASNELHRKSVGRAYQKDHFNNWIKSGGGSNPYEQPASASGELQFHSPLALITLPCKHTNVYLLRLSSVDIIVVN